MDEIVPVLSTSVTGPLGVVHLPRLWLKILLFSCGRLPEGYRHGEGGFDELLCTRLGLDREAFVRFIEDEKPDYLTTERWVRTHAKNLSPETIAAFNDDVLHVNMREEMAAERRARFAIADPTFANAVTLNNLDDWAGMHVRLTATTAV
jgi:hypothetical protein